MSFKVGETAVELGVLDVTHGSLEARAEEGCFLENV